MKRILFPVLVLMSFMIKAQTPQVAIPFEQHGDHIFIKISVDDSRPLDFIFDSGDSFTVIDINVARELGLKFKETNIDEVVTQLIEIKHNTVAVNDFLMESNIKVYASTLDHFEISIGRNVDGIIGYDLLRHHNLRINYDDMMFEIYGTSSFPKAGEPVPFRLDKLHVPVIEATAILNNGDEMKAEYFVNTGAGTSMDFNAPYASNNKIADKTGDHYSYLIKGLENQEHKHYEGRLKEFRIGSNSFMNVPIGISEAMGGLQAHKKVAGIIGNRMLRQFNVTFDYTGKKIYFEPNKSFGQPIKVNCSGIDVQLSKDKSKVLIHQVYANSPAAKAGIMVNDELVSIDGKSSVSIGLIEVEELLKKDGETVELVIKGSAGEKTIQLALKELI